MGQNPGGEFPNFPQWWICPWRLGHPDVAGRRLSPHHICPDLKSFTPHHDVIPQSPGRRQWVTLRTTSCWPRAGRAGVGRLSSPRPPGTPPPPAQRTQMTRTELCIQLAGAERQTWGADRRPGEGLRDDSCQHVSCQLSGVGCQLSDVWCQPQVVSVGCQQLSFVICHLSAVSRQSSVVNRQSSVISRQPSAATVTRIQRMPYIPKSTA